MSTLVGPHSVLRDHPDLVDYDTALGQLIASESDIVCLQGQGSLYHVNHISDCRADDHYVNLIKKYNWDDLYPPPSIRVGKLASGLCQLFDPSTDWCRYDRVPEVVGVYRNGKDQMIQYLEAGGKLRVAFESFFQNRAYNSPVLLGAFRGKDALPTLKVTYSASGKKRLEIEVVSCRPNYPLVKSIEGPLGRRGPKLEKLFVNFHGQYNRDYWAYMGTFAGPWVEGYTDDDLVSTEGNRPFHWDYEQFNDDGPLSEDESELYGPKSEDEQDREGIWDVEEWEEDETNERKD